MRTFFQYRIAQPTDAAVCIVIRGLTRENAISAEHLESLGITNASSNNSIHDCTLPGVVCINEDRIIGYCFGERYSGEIIVLALLPEFEGKGLGKILLARTSQILVEYDHSRLFLGCSPDSKTRSYGFYRNLGWRSTNTYDNNGDEILEYFPAANGDA